MRYSEFIVNPQKSFSLANCNPDFTGEFKNEEEAAESVRQDADDLAKHQNMLMAHEN